MYPKSDEPSRRILTFPAIHPSTTVSPATLLTSLLDLSRNILYFKSKFFVTRKRISRDLIRRVHILSIFFEEIVDKRLFLADSVVLSFTKLHLAFQKINFLLEDCTRRDARLWILMESKLVLFQFSVLIRDVADALDVLPLDSIDVSIDVKEHVLFLMSQRKKGMCEMEADDGALLDNVVTILHGFESRIAPDLSDLKWVLDHLWIRRWSDCNEVIKFLELEISLSEEYSKILLLSSLLGFMNYSRCFVFDTVDVDCIGCDRISGKKFNAEMFNCIDPVNFRCPISLDFMMDPVTISSGHTYERASIQKWFKNGKPPTCPQSGVKLKSKELIPNLVIRGLVRQYCSIAGISVPESSGDRNHSKGRRSFIGSLVAEESMKMLADFLTGKLAGGTSEERNKAALEIRLLTRSNAFSRDCLVKSGLIPYLLPLLSSNDSVTQKNSMAAIMNLSKDSKSIIVQNNGLSLIIDVLKKGPNLQSRQLAAMSLFYLSSIEDCRRIIGENPEAIPSLVELIKIGTDGGKKIALVAIFGLLVSTQNMRRVLDAGLVPSVINLLQTSTREYVITDSLTVLSTLAEKPDGAMAILCHGSVKLIAGFLDSESTSREGKEHCVSLLVSLCVNGGRDVVSLLVNNPSLMGSLYSTITDGSPRASKKASSLISILQDFHEK